MSTSKIIKYAFSYLWLLSAICGMALLVDYSTTKGSSTQLEKKQWPINSRIERDIHPTLVMFVHPFCPCSQASIGELERLMPFLKDKVNVNVVFISLKNMKGATATEWKQTHLYKVASKIPGVNILRDDNETEAQLFGAETSGHTAFFDHKGKLIFTGGLTPARGHMGDTIGRTAILGWIQNNKNDLLVESSIFGCALRSPASK